MPYNLQFSVNTSGANDLAQLDAIVQKLSGSTKGTAADLNALNLAIRADINSGYSLADALKTAASSGEGTSAGIKALAKEAQSFSGAANQAAASASNASAATQRFSVISEAAAGSAARLAAATRNVGAAHTALVPQVAAASGAIRLFEGAAPLRAVERFATNVLGLGPLLQKAFPVVGALAFGEILFTTGEKVYEFFKKVQEAPTVIRSAFSELGNALALSNDQLQLSNDKLADDIAKIELKPRNGLAVALDEARVAADQLAQSIDKDIGAVQNLLKENRVSITREVLGEAPTTDIEAEIKRYRDRIDAINSKNRNAIPNDTKIGGISLLSPGVLTKQKDDIQAQSDRELNDALADAIAHFTAELKNARVPGAFINPQARIEGLQGAIDIFTARQQAIPKQAAHADLEGKLAKDRAEKLPSEVNRSDQEAIELKSNLASIQKGELTGLDAINAEHAALIDKLREEDKLYSKEHPGAKPNPKDTPQNEKIADQIAAAEIDKYNQRLALAQKQSDRAQSTTATEEIRRVDATRAAGREQIQLAQGRDSGQDKAAIEAAHQTRLAEAKQQLEDSLKHIDDLIKDRDESQQIKKDPLALIAANRAINDAALKASGALANSVAQDQVKTELELEALKKKRFEDEDAHARNLRTVADASTKADIEDNKANLTHREALITAQEPGPGNELDVAIRQRDLRQQIATIDRDEKKRQIEEDRAQSQKILAQNPDNEQAQKKTEAELAALRVAEVENQRGYERELADERIELELKIADVRKQELEKFGTVVGGLFDAIVHRQPNAVANFLKEQVIGIGRTIAENAAKAYVFPTLRKIIPDNPDGPMGALFKGLLPEKTPEVPKTAGSQSALNAGIDWYALAKARDQSTAAADVSLLTGKGANPNESPDPFKTAAPALENAGTHLSSAAADLTAAARSLQAPASAPLEGTAPNALGQTVNQPATATAPAVNVAPEPTALLHSKTLNDAFSAALDKQELGGAGDGTPGIVLNAGTIADMGSAVASKLPKPDDMPAGSVTVLPGALAKPAASSVNALPAAPLQPPAAASVPAIAKEPEPIESRALADNTAVTAENTTSTSALTRAVSDLYSSITGKAAPGLAQSPPITAAPGSLEASLATTAATEAPLGAIPSASAESISALAAQPASKYYTPEILQRGPTGILASQQASPIDVTASNIPTDLNAAPVSSLAIPRVPVTALSGLPAPVRSVLKAAEEARPFSNVDQPGIGGTTLSNLVQIPQTKTQLAIAAASILPIGKIAEAAEGLAGGAEVTSAAVEAQNAVPQQTRLYRVDSPKATQSGIPEWMLGSDKHEAIKNATGRWFAQDTSELPFYLKDSDPGATISHVDIPAADLDKYRVVNQPQEVKQFSARPDKEFFLPKDIASQRVLTHPDDLPEEIRDQYLPTGPDGKLVYPEGMQARLPASAESSGAETQNAAQSWQVPKSALVAYKDTVPTRTSAADTRPNDYSEAALNANTLRNRNLEDAPPVVPPTYPIGSWGTDSTGELMQLRRYQLTDPKLIFPEGITHPGNPTVQKYSDWIESGSTPPPLRAIETEKGNVRIQDGHHRAAAIQATGGDSVDSWVSITQNRPLGNGQVMPEGVTHEQAVRSAVEAGEPVPPAVLADYPDIPYPAVAQPPALNLAPPSQAGMETAQPASKYFWPDTPQRGEGGGALYKPAPTPFDTAAAPLAVKDTEKDSAALIDNTRAVDGNTRGLADLYAGLTGKADPNVPASSSAAGASQDSIIGTIQSAAVIQPTAALQPSNASLTAPSTGAVASPGAIAQIATLVGGSAASALPATAAATPLGALISGIPAIAKIATLAGSLGNIGAAGGASASVDLTALDNALGEDQQANNIGMLSAESGPVSPLATYNPSTGTFGAGGVVSGGASSEALPTYVPDAALASGSLSSSGGGGSTGITSPSILASIRAMLGGPAPAPSPSASIEDPGYNVYAQAGVNPTYTGGQNGPLEDPGYNVYQQAGVNPNYSGSQTNPGPNAAAGISNSSLALTAAGVAGAGVMAAIDFSKGTTSKDLQGAGLIAGAVATTVSTIAKVMQAASPLLSAIPVVGALAAVALPLIGSFFNGPQQRANQINTELGKATYNAPQALNVTQDSSGDFTDFDARGNIRTSDFSAIPTVRQASTWEQTHGLFGGPPTFFQVPGGQTAQFGAVAPGTPPPVAPVVAGPAANTSPTNVYISAMDVASFNSFAMKNSTAFGNAGAKALQDAHGAFSIEIQRTAGG